MRTLYFYVLPDNPELNIIAEDVAKEDITRFINEAIPEIFADYQETDVEEIGFLYLDTEAKESTIYLATMPQVINYVITAY